MLKTSSTFRYVLLLSLVSIAGLGCSSSSTTAVEQPVEVVPDVVAMLNGSAITLDEFKTNFDRNGRVPGEDSVSADDYEEFLSRFVDFRLKVLEARRIGLQDDPTLQTEVQQYRLQLARPYIMERRVFEPLVREMYDRRTDMVEASHILLTVQPNASPEDTLTAWNQLTAIRDSVVAGASFGQLAAQYSQDPSAAGQPGNPGYQGQLGYFGGGRMVEAFEDMAFNTAVGEVSSIFRTQFGYHVLQVTDRKRLPADRELAHVMVRQQGATPADQAATEAKLDSIQAHLERGEAFAEVARTYSDDQNSAVRGGNIGRLAFDAGLPFTFRDAAFGIETEGQWAGPVRTNFGYHFIQFNSSFPLGSFDEEYESMKSRISQMPRTQAAQDAFATRIVEEEGAWVDSSLVEGWVESMSQDSLVRWMALTDFSTLDDDPVFVEFADSTLSLSEFAKFFRRITVPAARTAEQRVYGVVDQWLAERAIDFEVNQLEQRDPEFAATMQDFRDGLLLFRFMEKEVWEKAATDTTALEAHFAEHGSSYRFPDRTRVVSYSSVNEEGLNRLVTSIRGSSLDAALTEAEADTLFVLRADTTFIAEPSGSIFDQVLSLNQGEITDASSYNQGWIALYNDGIDPEREMTFDEARSELVNEVQADLESQLMADLRVQYGVVLYPEALQALIPE
jgi:peptidyl-prolyl cis-trans isomerase SurA